MQFDWWVSSVIIYFQILTQVYRFGATDSYTENTSVFFPLKHFFWIGEEAPPQGSPCLLGIWSTLTARQMSELPTVLKREDATLVMLLICATWSIILTFYNALWIRLHYRTFLFLFLFNIQYQTYSGFKQSQEECWRWYFILHKKHIKWGYIKVFEQVYSRANVIAMPGLKHRPPDMSVLSITLAVPSHVKLGKFWTFRVPISSYIKQKVRVDHF